MVNTKQENNCAYCKEDNCSTHFICECCKVGMCDDCYDLYTEHINHYHQVIENCDSNESIELITNFCNGIAPEYFCEKCLKKALREKEIKGQV